MLLRNGKLPITYQTVIPGYEKVPNYLIRDLAYPLIPHCLKECDTCDTNEKVIVNNLLTAARNPVKYAFGHLKAMWAVLTKKVEFDVITVPTMIYACFVLHNFCEKNNTGIDEELVQDPSSSSCTRQRINRQNRLRFVYTHSSHVTNLLVKLFLISLTYFVPFKAVP